MFGTEMEDKEVGLTAALHSLVTGVTIWSYFHHHAYCIYQVDKVGRLL